MFGKHWTPARGTVVDRRGSTTGDGTVTTYEFVVDVTTASGEVFRAKAEEPRIATDFKDPQVGDSVAVEYDPESRKVRFDKDDPALSWKHYKKARADTFDAALAAPPGTPPPMAPGRRVPGRRVPGVTTTAFPTSGPVAAPGVLAGAGTAGPGFAARPVWSRPGDPASAW